MTNYFTNVPSGDAQITVTQTDGTDVVLNGFLYINGEEDQRWTQSSFDQPIVLSVLSPKRYRIIVNAIFGTGSVTITVDVAGREKSTTLTGDADDNGEDFLDAQFAILTELPA